MQNQPFCAYSSVDPRYSSNSLRRYKGPDKNRFNISEKGESPADEIKEYTEARYLSASEAAWRIFGFHVYSRTPTCLRLPVHLDGDDYVFLNEDADADEEAEIADTLSKLDRYFARPKEKDGKRDAHFDNILYSDYMAHYRYARKKPTSLKEADVWEDAADGDLKKGKKVDQRMFVWKMCVRCIR